MEDLKDEISKQLLKLEHMVSEQKDKKEIAEQKRLLDKLLEEYVSDLWRRYIGKIRHETNLYIKRK